MKVALIALLDVQSGPSGETSATVLAVLSFLQLSTCYQAGSLKAALFLFYFAHDHIFS